MTSNKGLTETIIRVIQETLAEKGEQPPSLTPDSGISENLGLDSLDWAAIVVRLEEETGIDPFRQGFQQELRTISDFVALYRVAMS